MATPIEVFAICELVWKPSKEVAKYAVAIQQGLGHLLPKQIVMKRVTIGRRETWQQALRPRIGL